MAILHNNVVPALPTGGYTIDQSLRFEDGSSAYLSRTPASAGNRRTWTWSGWVKRGNVGTVQNFGLNVTSATNDGGWNTTKFEADGTIRFDSWNYYITTAAQYRDPSAWYHIVIVLDTTNATSTDRMRMYVNGERITTATSNYPTQNLECGINSTSAHVMGYYPYSSNQHFDGYLSEVNFIDGQALTPDSFGEVDATYGHWKPIEYTGTYGTNGFYLPFSGTFYNDASGNGNNWTANNLATTDVVLDSPTNNFATLNPLNKGSNTTLSEGSCKITQSASAGICLGTFGYPSTGKWYYEYAVLSGGAILGIATTTTAPTATYVGSTIGGYGYYSANGQKYNNGSGSAYGATYTTGDVIGVAFDADAGTLTFYKNNVSQGTAFTSLTDTYAPSIGESNGNSGVANFGQDSSFAGNKTAQNNTDDNGYGDFYYSPPSGFLALCTANLSDPAVVPGENFNTVLYTGNGSTNAISGVGFQPDLVWIKDRSASSSHRLTDLVRGVEQQLMSNETTAEESAPNGLQSFDSDGFTVGSSGSYNTSGNSHVAWNWKADGTSGSSNTDGSITSTVAANVDAGFSIVSYTGTGANATVGHGLSSAPEMVIVKERGGTGNWFTYHENAQSSGAYVIYLNLTNAAASSTAIFNNTQPTSSVFNLGTGNSNTSSDTYIAYCFHSVDGYSKFGSYTGNGSTDGTFVYTGFRPAFVMMKASSRTGSWCMFDYERNQYNEVNELLNAEVSDAEYANVGGLDFLGNGFKLRTDNTNRNLSGDTYIYMAFAEYPFKYTNAR